jgi:hypothetical protein
VYIVGSLNFNDGTSTSTFSTFANAANIDLHYTTLSNNINTNYFTQGALINAIVMDSTTSITQIIPNLTSNATIIANGTYQNGLYRVFFSSNTIYDGYKAFDNSSATAWGTVFNYNSATGYYNGTSSILGYAGEWLLISLPHAPVINNINIQVDGYYTGTPTSAYSIFLIGANAYVGSGGLNTNNLTYDFLYQGPINSNSNVSFVNTTSYNTYIIVFRQFNAGIGGGGVSNNLIVNYWNMAGSITRRKDNICTGITGCYFGSNSSTPFTIPIPCSLGLYGNFNAVNKDSYYVVNSGYKIVVYNASSFGGSVVLTADNTYGNSILYMTGTLTGASCILYYNLQPIFGNNF